MAVAMRLNRLDIPLEAGSGIEPLYEDLQSFPPTIPTLLSRSQLHHLARGLGEKQGHWYYAIECENSRNF